MSNEMDMFTLSKSLRLLHASDEDSAEQLRLILEETIKAKYGMRKPINPMGLGVNKRAMIVEDLPARKKSKLIESVKSSIPILQQPSPTLETSSDTDSEDMALEILEDDLTCVVCRGMAVGARNRLVECLECHSLYHQECHNPPILESTINDPRLVWYCDSCTKAISQAQTKDGYSSSGSPSSSGSGSLPSKHSKPDNSSSKLNFPSSSSSKSYTGVPGSNKNMSSNALSSKHLILNSKNNPIVVPKINIISADKRLQIMKKKAAKKQEKRKIIK